MLFLPGLGMDHTVWGYQARRLSNKFCCIGIDNRDVGKSDCAPADYTINDMAGDTIGIMDGLGIASAHVVGWSMGSAIAQEVAINWPERVNKLCLVASYHYGDPRGTERHETFAKLRGVLDPETYLKIVYPWSFSYQSYQKPGFIERMRKRALENPSTQPKAAYERQVAATINHHARGRLSAITAETLVLVGEEDILTPPVRFARAMAEEIPRSKLVIIPEVGHSLLSEAPDAVTEALEDFLSRS